MKSRLLPCRSKRDQKKGTWQPERISDPKGLPPRNPAGFTPFTQYCPLQSRGIVEHLQQEEVEADAAMLVRVPVRLAGVTAVLILVSQVIGGSWCLNRIQCGQLHVGRLSRLQRSLKGLQMLFVPHRPIARDRYGPKGAAIQEAVYKPPRPWHRRRVEAAPSPTMSDTKILHLLLSCPLYLQTNRGI